MQRFWELRRTWHGKIVRALAGVGGGLILYHEVWIAETAEPLLVFLGLWLFGVPPAMFFDGLRKIGQRAQSEVDAALSGDTTNLPPPADENDKASP